MEKVPRLHEKTMQWDRLCHWEEINKRLSASSQRYES